MRISLAEKHPGLVVEWSNKNNPLTPNDVTFGSNRIVWWKGSCGHEWQACIKNRSNGAGCPICSGNKVSAGINDLQTLFPEIARQWSGRNKGKSPGEVSAYTNRRVWWKCKNGHEWFARIADRTSGHGCPYCCGNSFETGINDLETLFPQIARMWSAKNGLLAPSMVSPKSRENVWWQCQVCGYEWKMVIHTMVRNDQCPVCVGKKVAKGINDLATTDPELTKEWLWEKNDKTPYDVFREHKWAVWWKGTCGHEWRARIFDRAVRQEGCKICEGQYQKVLPLLLMTFYAKKLGLELFLKDEIAEGILLEMYLPDISLAVEFYEERTLEGQKRENVKNYLCRKKRITLIKIIEWKSAEDLGEKIINAFSFSDIFIRTNVSNDLAFISNRYFKYVQEQKHDFNLFI